MLVCHTATVAKIMSNLCDILEFLPEINIQTCTAKNLLTAIPDGIGALSKLIRLDLHQNS